MDCINTELELNIRIDQDILPVFQKQIGVHKNQFKLSLVEPRQNQSFLDLKNKSPSLLQAAFKFIQKKDVRMVDFSGIGIDDDCIQMLAYYLELNANLRSIKLDNNTFTD